MKISSFFQQLIDSGESQTSIARKCGISQSTVNNLLQGGDETPRTSTVRRIADAYNKPISYFLDEWGYELSIQDPDHIKMTDEEKELVRAFRGLKSLKIAVRQLLNMTEDERLDWVINKQDQARNGG